MINEGASAEQRIEDFRSDVPEQEIVEAKLENIQAIAMQAYIFGLPAFLNMRQLTEFIQGRKYFAPNEEPLSGWVLVRELSDSSTNNNAPNVDTLYGASYLTLEKQGPVVLSVPEIKNRYYSIAVHDAYFNVIDIISPRTHGTEGGKFLIVPPTWEEQTPADVDKIIVSPTPNVTLYQRIFANDPSEYDELHKMQDEITIRTPNGEFLPAVDLTDYQIANMRDTEDPIDYFKFVNQYTGLNRPPIEMSGLMELFAAIGLGPDGKLPDDQQSLDAIRLGARRAQALINATISEGPFRDGWKIPDPFAGKPNAQILSRAVCQLTQIGSLLPEEATYYFANRDGNEQPLRGDNDYTLTFDGKSLPPISDTGFWSVTMYNEKLLLVDNPLNRYILRPNSPELVWDDDGGLTLHLQSHPPKNAPEANWLPAPDGSFTIALRAYNLRPAALNGAWFPPPIYKKVENR